MTPYELAVALKREFGKGLSQSYISQIESGVRRHLTNASRLMLARFFRVHPDISSMIRRAFTPN